MVDSLTKKWIKTAADEEAAKNGCYFDEEAAMHVVDFFPQFLRHSKGRWAGRPFELLDWQATDMMMPLFGWKRDDGLRRFRQCYCEVPKKNGKSTLASGLGLYMLTGDGEAGAEVYSAATDQSQASIVHGEAINMVLSSPDLDDVLHVNKSNKNIIFEETRSNYKALSSDAHSKEGLNAHCIICDELHVWRGRVLWDAFKYAFRAREQGLLFAITTAGSDMLSVCREQHDYAQSILAGTNLDERFFPLIYSVDTEDDWTDPKCWYKANPSLGHTIKEEDFSADVEEAKKTPATQSSFKRYSLNIWATSTNPWLPMDKWNTICADDYDDEFLRELPCYAGLDLAKTRDMTALVLLFYDHDRSVYLQRPYYWLPEATVIDPDSNEYYRVWAKQNHLTVTSGEVCDYRQLVSDIAKLNEQFSIEEIRYDVHFADQVAQELDEDHGIPMVPFGQTMMNFSAPTSEYERLIIDGKLKHNRNPILTWQAENVQVKEDVNQNKRPVKPTKNDPRKIDGIVASVMALSAAVENGTPGSVYDERELISF